MPSTKRSAISFWLEYVYYDFVIYSIFLSLTGLIKLFCYLKWIRVPLYSYTHLYMLKCCIATMTYLRGFLQFREEDTDISQLFWLDRRVSGRMLVSSVSLVTRAQVIFSCKRYVCLWLNVPHCKYLQQFKWIWSIPVLYFKIHFISRPHGQLLGSLRISSL